ncbi:unnamed protein product [Effrenium voratum]|nr:unnamed protein product [Effrenium voratum]
MHCSLDGNGDGKVTADELKQWEPKDEFGSMEKNGDGEITMQEFQKFNPQHAVVKTGGSGELLELSHASFPSLDARIRQIREHQDTFSQLDRNHDGKLSAEELKAWPLLPLGVLGEMHHCHASRRASEGLRKLGTSQQTDLAKGGNAGIGLALCKQLTYEGRHVYLGSRSLEKGAAAVKAIMDGIPAGCAGKCDVVQLDTSSDSSVAAAVEAVKSSLGSDQLYGIVNNAGTGLGHGVTADVVMNTNLFGPKRVIEGFMPLLNKEGRIVNVGSGAGPMYVARPTGGAALSCSVWTKVLPSESFNIASWNRSFVVAGEEFLVLVPLRLCNPEITWPEIAEHAKSGLGSAADAMGGYGPSKALLSCYTMLLAREHPSLSISCISPGFIDTGMTSGMGASKSPEEGTVSIRHCLFEKLPGNGWPLGGRE